ncbi:MAG: RNA ligase family protein [Kofleriaceae bacterium]
MSILKYPRTPHLEGSRLQPGDEDLASAPFSVLAGRHVVVEEKVDGGNAGISFTEDGQLRLQSRGHYLTGGPRERHFALLKQWAHTHAQVLHERLGARYVLYGEWLYAKHTVYYDALPHYFLEFDLYDRQAQAFLSTPRRRQLLDGAPVVSVPVLAEGPVTTLRALRARLTPSRFKTPRWRERLRETAAARGLDVERVIAETDRSDLMEGLYVKVEEEGVVAARYKLVRPDFLTTILDAGTHWLDRPIVPNGLRDPEPEPPADEDAPSERGAS